MRIFALVNTLSSVASVIYSNHIEFWTNTKKQYPNDQFFFFTPPRMSIDMARNNAAKQAMALECDYLLFIDDDVLLPPNTLSELIACESDIAAGLVIIRSYPFNVMAFKREGPELTYFNDLPMAKEGNGLKNPITEGDGLVAVGFSCTLIRVDLLRKVPEPYFVTGPRNTEDVYFCLKAYDTLYNLSIPKILKISMNTALQCGHMLHAEPIEWKTREFWKSVYEDLRPEEALRLQNESKGRDLEYIRRNLEIL